MAKSHSTVASLAESFAAEVFALIKGMTIGEIVDLTDTKPARGKPGPKSKRSTAAHEKVIDAIVGVLKRHTDGMRAEEIRGALSLTRKDIDRPIAGALASKMIKKTGQKRATRYFVR
jgi:hypothetical protein